MRWSGIALLVTSLVGCGRLGYQLERDGGAVGLDAAGLDAAALDAAGLDATALDATGLDAAALDASLDGGEPGCGEAFFCDDFTGGPDPRWGSSCGGGELIAGRGLMGGDGFGVPPSLRCGLSHRFMPPVTDGEALYLRFHARWAAAGGSINVAYLYSTVNSEQISVTWSESGRVELYAAGGTRGYAAGDVLPGAERWACFVIALRAGPTGSIEVTFDGATAARLDLDTSFGEWDMVAIDAEYGAAQPGIDFDRVAVSRVPIGCE